MKPTDDNLHDLPELSHWVGGTVWARCPRCKHTLSLAPTQSGTSLEATTDSGFERLRLVATIGAVATHTCGSEEPQPATLPEPPSGWYRFGTHAGWDVVPPLVFSDEVGENGDPLFERRPDSAPWVNCTCGYGGLHEPLNPRCERARAEGTTRKENDRG